MSSLLGGSYCQRLGLGFQLLQNNSEATPVGRQKGKTLRKQVKFGAQMLVLENRENEGSRCGGKGVEHLF